MISSLKCSSSKTSTVSSWEETSVGPSKPTITSSVVGLGEMVISLVTVSVMSGFSWTNDSLTTVSVVSSGRGISC